MRRFGALPLALTLAALTAMPVVGNAFPSRIDLPDGWRPEGIAAGHGTVAYVGSLADGGIARVDLRTGAVDPDFVESATGPAVGLEYDVRGNRLWVAGGPSGEIRVYDAASGELLATFDFAAGFVNDLVVTADAVYATDSFLPQLLVVPLGDGGSLPAAAATLSLAITGAFEYVDGFNANGIVEHGGRLIVPQSGTGRLFSIDPESGSSVEILPAGSVTAADGLLVMGSTLYVVRNQLAIVDIYRLGAGSPVLVATIADPGLDVPTTVAFAAGSLWASNARFNTPPTPDTAYWITRLPAR